MGVRGAWLAVAASGFVLAPAIGMTSASAAWQFTVGSDPFSDLPMVTAEVETDAGDHLSIACDENKALVTVFSPAREIRAEDFEVRYRVDGHPPVVSGLEWVDLNGRARAVLVSKTSLFGDRSQAEQVEEFRQLGRELIAGVTLVIEAGGEFASFSLARSAEALEAVLSACEVTLEAPAESG